MIARETIAAIATAPGRAAIGVVRVSGFSLEDFIQSLTRRHLQPRRATVVRIRDAQGELIDEGIALYFPAPASYTGEDVLEFQGHGGAVVLGQVLQRCLELGARLAVPGEFTHRAFSNGKMDLVQAESVIDLIDASTAQAARSAMRSLQGEFSAAIEKLADDLIELRARVEATLDFPDEEIELLEDVQARMRLKDLLPALEAVLQSASRGSLLREGIHIVLAGQPNVGKSSLLNRLAGEDLAIVTEIPGTTRDPIRQAISLDGVPVHVVDTAGLRESHDPVETVGIQRAWSAIERADVVVLVVDARVGPGEPDYAILARLPQGLPRITVLNKIDLAAMEPASVETSTGQVLRVSAKTGAGLDLLRDALLAQAGWGAETEGVFLARQRHLDALKTAKRYLTAARGQDQPELLAEDLRLAHDALGAITGKCTPDDLLGEIFQRFCIGK